MTQFTQAQMFAAIDAAPVNPDIKAGMEAFENDVWGSQSLGFTLSVPAPDILDCSFSGGGWTVNVADGPNSETPLLPHMTPQVMPGGLQELIGQTGAQYLPEVIADHIAQDVWTSGVYNAGAQADGNGVDCLVQGANNWCAFSVNPTT